MKSYKESYQKYSKMKKEDLIELLINRDRAIDTIIKNNDQIINLVTNLSKDFERINEDIKKCFKDE